MKKLLDIMVDMFVFWVIVPIAAVVLWVALTILAVFAVAFLALVPIRTAIKGKK